MEITKAQKQLMRHTIAADNVNEERNWFGTDIGCKDAIEFDKLVEGGLATKHGGPLWSGDDVIYRLTEDGIWIANN